MWHKDQKQDDVFYLSVSLRVCGSYADMSAGLPSEACKDFSGGVHMTYELGEAHTSGHDEELWLQLSRATGCRSMVCCGTAPKGVRTKSKEENERRKKEHQAYWGDLWFCPFQGRIVNTVANTGLVDAHAYSVTAVTEVKHAVYSSYLLLTCCQDLFGLTCVWKAACFSLGLSIDHFMFRWSIMAPQSSWCESWTPGVKLSGTGTGVTSKPITRPPVCA